MDLAIEGQPIEGQVSRSIINWTLEWTLPVTCTYIRKPGHSLIRLIMKFTAQIAGSGASGLNTEDPREIQSSTSRQYLV